MNKSIILSVLVAASGIVNTASAQKGFYAGAQVAPQISVMYNKGDFKNEAYDPKSTFSKAFGINGGYNFTKNMGVATEVMYSMQGQKYTENGLDFTKRADYLKVPVMFAYNSNPDKKVVFTAKAGPQVSMLMSSKLNADTKGADKSYDTHDQYKRFTFGGTLGAGVRVNVAKGLYLDGGLRLDCAFTNAEDKNASGYKAGRSKTYNANAGLEIGAKYFFN